MNRLIEFVIDEGHRKGCIVHQRLIRPTQPGRDGCTVGTFEAAQL